MLAGTRGARRTSEKRIASFPWQPLMDVILLQHQFPWTRNCSLPLPSWELKTLLGKTTSFALEIYVEGISQVLIIIEHFLLLLGGKVKHI